MYKFSERSQKNLVTCDPRLQALFNEVIRHVDCTIIEGHRGEQRQNELFSKGLSKVKWPNGKHNKKPSLAVDAAPYVNGKIDWNNRHLFYYFAGMVKGIAMSQNINIRFGGDWDGDFDLTDQNFNDLCHFELK